MYLCGQTKGGLKYCPHEGLQASVFHKKAYFETKPSSQAAKCPGKLQVCLCRDQRIPQLIWKLWTSFFSLAFYHQYFAALFMPITRGTEYITRHLWNRKVLLPASRSQGNGDRERLSDAPKVTQEVSGRPGTGTQVSLVLHKH